jgi:phage terminase small subunit
MKKKLTKKQEMFVKEYLIDLNATQAAIRSGYSPKTSGRIGDQNLKKLVIQEAIKKAMDKRSEKTEITAEYVLEVIRDTVERCRQNNPVLDRNGEQVYIETKDGKVAPAFVFDAKNVLRGSELLGKHLSMFNEKIKVDHTNSDGSMKPPITRIEIVPLVSEVPTDDDGTD